MDRAGFKLAAKLTRTPSLKSKRQTEHYSTRKIAAEAFNLCLNGADAQPYRNAHSQSNQSMLLSTASARATRTIALSLLLLALAVALPNRAAQANTTDQGGYVARAQFSTAIVDREPVDNLSQAPGSIEKVFFFSELTEMTGQTIRHRWIYNGNPVIDVSFAVKGPRWRVFSSKTMRVDTTGNWRVTVLNEADEVLESQSIAILPVPPATRSATDTPQRSATPAQPPPPIPANIAAIMQRFPSGDYRTDQLDNPPDCPLAGRFEWANGPASFWYFEMSTEHRLPVSAVAGNAAQLQPIDSVERNCETSTGHHFDPSGDQLVVEQLHRCVDQTTPVFSFTTLQRHAQLLRVTFFGNRFARCQYQYTE